jgi:PleD family two-component response regulator
MGSAFRVLAVGLDPGELPGCRVETADDLLGALATFADGDVEVVLLSLDLPDAQGPDAVRALRERAPQVPVVALAVGEDDAREAIGAGARDALPVDAEPGLLLRAARHAVEVARLEAELDRARTVDELTGLPNARGLERIAASHLRLADRSRVPVRLVVVRLEGDRPGVDAEERRAFVAETAEALRRAVRASDVLASVDEGTFCVLLTAVATGGGEATVLSRLVEAVAATNARSGRPRELRLSVGAATYDPERPVSLGELVEAAEGRLGPPPA